MHGRLLLLGLITIVGTGGVFQVGGLRINTSASLPVGLYITSSEGAFAEFCPDDHGLSTQRGYRRAALMTPWGKGGCPDGAAPLVKPLIGKPGDEIVLSPAGLTVNGKLLRNTAPLTHDSAGRPLMHWPFGRYIGAPGTLWVASSYNQRSYDSRYLGPIQQSAVRARLRTLFAR